MVSIDVAVIGVGSMGKHHARIYSKMPNVNLIAISDTDKNKVIELSEQYQCRGYTDYERMLADTKPRAVSIATPATTHYEIARKVLAEAHVLIEKPMTAIYADALILYEQAKRLNRVLMPGHLLRFKPVTERLIDMLSNDNIGEVYHIAFERHSKYAGRCGDVSILLDVGVHDCDMLYYLYPSLVYDTLKLNGVGKGRISTEHLDYFYGTLKSKNSFLTASFDYNRTEKSVKGNSRKMTLYGSDGVLVVNWAEKGIRKNHKDRYYPYQEHDALEMQLSYFISTVMGEVTGDRLGSLNGVYAVRLAKELEHTTLGGWNIANLPEQEKRYGK